ncbi:MULTISPECIES: hypothetical protein [unclassified Streptomyces]|uniref:hypothetical protein n=1 Tax=unclassified Streptomyces TaxID=2593676 RepID=UPI0033A0BEB8
MVYVNLPEISLEGEWTVSEGERTLAARLLPMLPAAPPPGADLATRWDVVDTSLRTVLEVVRDNGDLLFADAAAVVSRPGKVNMIDMPFAIGRLFHEIHSLHQLMLSKSAAAGNEFLESCADRLEPEVAELRRLLAEAAQGVGGQ